MSSYVAQMYGSMGYSGGCYSWKQVPSEKIMFFGQSMKVGALKASVGLTCSSMFCSINEKTGRVLLRSDGWKCCFSVASERVFGLDDWMVGVSARNAGRRKLFMVSCIANDEIITEEKVRVLVIGGGGREHALCYALQRSPSCSIVYCAPGNVGISSSGDANCIQDFDPSDSSAVISFCQREGINLVVVGPEGPLVSGLVNDLVKAGISTFGPSSQAAALEGSKDFMKSLCYKYGIPTAKV
ncbi:hypothetical protein KSS87_004624 [Heliosperma pusillum]|nr:hypothetical protein KSS87_004624 [Heliosperma pusillum]